MKVPALLVSGMALPAFLACGANIGFNQTNLVSDLPGVAAHLEPLIVTVPPGSGTRTSAPVETLFNGTANFGGAPFLFAIALQDGAKHDDIARSGNTGAFVAALDGADRTPVVNQGLRSLAFGNGAGRIGEDHGSFARIDSVPEPSSGTLAILGFGLVAIALTRRPRRPRGK
jgi:hypothetical protein